MLLLGNGEKLGVNFLQGRLGRGKTDNGYIALVQSLFECGDIFLQPLFFIPGHSQLAVQDDQAQQVQAGPLGHLPFLPGHVQIHCGGLVPGRGHLGIVGQERDNVIIQPQAVSLDRPCGGPGHGNVEAIGKSRIRKNARLDELRLSQALLVANGPELGIGDDRQNGRFIWRKAIAQVKVNRPQEGMVDQVGFNRDGFQRRRGQGFINRGLIQRHGVIRGATGEDQGQKEEQAEHSTCQPLDLSTQVGNFVQYQSKDYF